MNHFKKTILASAITAVLLTGCDTEDGNDGVDSSSTFISLEQAGRYSSNIFDESAAEIVAFDETTDQIFVINSNSGGVDVVNASNIENLTFNFSIDVATNSEAAIAGFSAGAANSVAVNDGLMAVAIAADTKTNDGVVAFYKTSDNSFLAAISVGALPDMLTFTPDGSQVVVAMEGEPSDDNYAVDPEAEVAIIDITWDGSALTTNLTELNFTDFNTGNTRASEVPDNIVLNNVNGATFSQDIEPEYIAVSKDSSEAYVSLQENSAIAVINLATKSIDKIYALGFKDHSIPGNELDGNNKDDQVAIKSEPYWGQYQPDSIASMTVNGKNYILTANEGDDRADWIVDFNETTCEANNFYFNREDNECGEDIKLKDALDNAVYAPTDPTKTLDLTNFDTGGDLEGAVNRLKFSHSATMAFGDIDGDGAIDKLLSYGARSFSIWDVETGHQIFDSGNDLETITAMRYGANFNQSNDELAAEDRSDNKGPEPEAITVGTIEGKTYAFIGLERMGGIMVYNVSNPHNAEYVQYINNRDMTLNPDDNVDSDSDGIKEYTIDAGDLGPEGFDFVSAENSPSGEPLLVVGSEVSGTTTVYKININR